jgi:hypothetical protein
MVPCAGRHVFRAAFRAGDELNDLFVRVRELAKNGRPAAVLAICVAVNKLDSMPPSAMSAATLEFPFITPVRRGNGVDTVCLTSATALRELQRPRAESPVRNDARGAAGEVSGGDTQFVPRSSVAPPSAQDPLSLYVLAPTVPVVRSYASTGVIRSASATQETALGRARCLTVRLERVADNPAGVLYCTAGTYPVGQSPQMPTRRFTRAAQMSGT